ncbi:MAG: YraN family protein [Proteobacteria bacterium]|nr:YraN family protein [Pseudomonadota bacterium]
MKAKSSGKQAEDIAKNYLVERAIKIVSRNFHSRFGEIDIIGIDNDILIFFEIRYRKNEHFLSAVETVDQHKCKKIVITSEVYLNKHKKYQSYFCRYDVITISGALEQPVIEWIKNAFQA